jgi:citrate lyase subunit beta/citryl-CoA lyase
VLLRINNDPAMWQEDLRGMPLEALTAIMLPKVESLEQVEALAKALTRSCAEQTPPIAALIETPRGVLAASTIATHNALCALGFGSEDYAGALGVPADPAALTWPAQQVLTCAHAHGLQCWGLAASIAEVNDMVSFAQAVGAARAMGFTGSVCIHPRQVPVVNKGFSPSEQELAWAQRVLAADEAARAQGLGAILLDGRMLDKPIVDRARRWLGLWG